MPGVNEATTIEFSEDVLVKDKPLAKGKYSIWAIPGKEEWTFIFNKEPDAWHSKYPEGQGVLRIKAKPETGSHMEVMAYYFPLVGPDSVTLNFHWGKTIVPIPIMLK